MMSLTLNDLLRSRGHDARNIVAIRNTLHPDDACDSFRTVDDVARAGALLREGDPVRPVMATAEAAPK